jgi:hypothetical protein
VVIENDDIFLTTDPFVAGSEDQLSSPWDEVYVGTKTLNTDFISKHDTETSLQEAGSQ